jgi:hypothetical protein
LLITIVYLCPPCMLKKVKVCAINIPLVKASMFSSITGGLSLASNKKPEKSLIFSGPTFSNPCQCTISCFAYPQPVPLPSTHINPYKDRTMNIFINFRIFHARPSYFHSFQPSNACKHWFQRLVIKDLCMSGFVA